MFLFTDQMNLGEEWQEHKLSNLVFVQFYPGTNITPRLYPLTPSSSSLILVYYNLDLIFVVFDIICFGLYNISLTDISAKCGETQ